MLGGFATPPSPPAPQGYALEPWRVGHGRLLRPKKAIPYRDGTEVGVILATPLPYGGGDGVTPPHTLSPSMMGVPPIPPSGVVFFYVPAVQFKISSHRETLGLTLRFLGKKATQSYHYGELNLGDFESDDKRLGHDDEATTTVTCLLMALFY